MNSSRGVSNISAMLSCATNFCHVRLSYSVSPRMLRTTYSVPRERWHATSVVSFMRRMPSAKSFLCGSIAPTRKSTSCSKMLTTSSCFSKASEPCVIIRQRRSRAMHFVLWLYGSNHLLFLLPSSKETRPRNRSRQILHPDYQLSSLRVELDACRVWSLFFFFFRDFSLPRSPRLLRCEGFEHNCEELTKRC